MIERIQTLVKIHRSEHITPHIWSGRSFTPEYIGGEAFQIVSLRYISGKVRISSMEIAIKYLPLWWRNQPSLPKHEGDLLKQQPCFVGYARTPLAFD